MLKKLVKSELVKKNIIRKQCLILLNVIVAYFCFFFYKSFRIYKYIKKYIIRLHYIVFVTAKPVLNIK